jgi:PIN domain
MIREPATPHFHIAFDTNLLFVEAENKLIKPPLSEFILERKETKTPQITWYLLDIVRAERRHQMLQVALKLVTHADKVGRLLGKDFGITKRDLEHGIDAVIAQDVKRHNLKIRKLDAKLIDWPALIERSTSRDPPFEAKTEKGFRDCIVLETFAQLVDEFSMPKARLILITNDGRLKEAVAQRMEGKDYVLTVDDVPTLKSMLNAFASHVGEQELELLLEKAQRLFYREGDRATLFHTWDIEDTIRDKHDDSLLQPPPDSTPGTFLIPHLLSVGPTTFTEKRHQEFTFATYLNFQVTAFIPITMTPPIRGSLPVTTGTAFSSTSSSVGTGLNPSVSTFGNLVSPSITSSNLVSPSVSTFGNLVSPSISSNLVSPTVGSRGTDWRIGIKVFEVKWSATVTAGHELKNPVLGQIRLHSADWP